MKELPKHLKYAFLGAERFKPLIIIAYLTELRERNLINFFRKYKEAIAWLVEDLKGVRVHLFACIKSFWRIMQKHPLNIKGD